MRPKTSAKKKRPRLLSGGNPQIAKADRDDVLAHPLTPKLLPDVGCSP